MTDPQNPDEPDAARPAHAAPPPPAYRARAARVRRSPPQPPVRPRSQPLRRGTAARVRRARDADDPRPDDGHRRVHPVVLRPARRADPRHRRARAEQEGRPQERLGASPRSSSARSLLGASASSSRSSSFAALGRGRRARVLPGCAPSYGTGTHERQRRSPWTAATSTLIRGREPHGRRLRRRRRLVASVSVEDAAVRRERADAVDARR